MITRFIGYRPNVPSATHNKFQMNDVKDAQYEGVIFSDGTCALRWLTECGSTSVWASFYDAMRIHGHPEYGTEIYWLDTPSSEILMWWSEFLESGGEK